VLRVLLADRSRLFAEALAIRLEREDDICVAAWQESATGARRLLGCEAVDVVVCDDQLAEELMADPPWRGAAADSPPVVVLADAGDDDRLARLAPAGIAGWVTRDQPVDLLLEAIRGAPRGETRIPPSLLTRVLRELTSTRTEQRAVANRLSALTEREREILALLSDGLDRAEVAARLHLSGHTVRTHLQNIRTSLGVHSTLAAVAVARAARSDIAVRR
jgi:DNA-binding NarL/FixJ family response regulator